jgi:small subunit ribosomal protein S20
MAHTKSALKRLKTNKKKHEMNKAIKSTLFTLEKKLRTAIEAGDEDVMTVYAAFTSKLDKAAKRNILHKNKIARKKSRLSQMIKAAK